MSKIITTVLVLACILLPFGQSHAEAPTYIKPVVNLKQYSVTALIEHFAEEYKVDPELMYLTMKCESGLNPNAVNSTKKEYSVGVSQINLKAHTGITVAQAKDPVFSTRFMAKEFARDNAKIWSCYNKIIK